MLFKALLGTSSTSYFALVDPNSPAAIRTFTSPQNHPNESPARGEPMSRKAQSAHAFTPRPLRRGRETDRKKNQQRLS